jgi:RNA polymerase sigma factor (sigma-70 family)
MATPDQHHSLGSLIERARDTSATPADRHEAFTQLVRRFEGLAFGCACARLRDPALAEDAAQDAFLVAWERLSQLRDPEAFPGWIRRLVLTQCSRRLRTARLSLVPLDEARHLTAPTSRSVDVDAGHDATVVHLALGQLGSADRLVLILFYGSGRSQAEIAEWLRLPVTTVARRLAHAKRRLQRHTLKALAGGLRPHRRTFGDAFVVELSARLERARAADGAGITDLTGSRDPDRVLSVGIPEPTCAYVVKDPTSEALIAYAAAVPTPFAPIFELHLAMGKNALQRHAGDVLIMQIVEELAARGAIALRHRISGRQKTLAAFLRARGFEIVSRAQDWRVAADEFARLTPFAVRFWDFLGLDAVSEDPALFMALRDLLTEVISEDDTERAFLPIHPDMLRRALRMQQYGVIALADGAIQGLMAAAADDVVANSLRINMAAVRKGGRRRGLATAMLARLLATSGRAAARISAHAQADLTAWLTRCGFRKLFDRLVLERLLRRTVRVAPERLEEYVGCYVTQEWPTDPVIIERHGDSLISKARDMRDLLLASSDSEFFTRHHYGQGRFERDHAGRVVRLVYREGPHEFVAVRRS